MYTWLACVSNCLEMVLLEMTFIDITLFNLGHCESCIFLANGGHRDSVDLVLLASRVEVFVVDAVNVSYGNKVKEKSYEL
jgi:hypothetical protein